MNQRQKIYSIVVPVYNEEEVLPVFYKRLRGSMDSLNDEYEIVFINDGSNDSSLKIIRGFQEKDRRIKILDFSRNFGHQAAITAGMDYAQGRAVVIIDADLQDPPEVIPSFIKKWKEGYDVVYGIRKERKGESFFKKFSAAMFYRILRKLTDMNVPVDAGDFRLLNREVVEVLKRIRERNRYIRGLISWAGFKQIGVFYAREERFAGKTKYSLKKMLKLAIDGIISFSSFPLRIATYLGTGVAIASFIYTIYAIFIHFFTEQTVAGWTSLIVAILFIGGLQLICLGLLGEYIGRINDEAKKRPLYIIKKVYEL